MLAEFAAAFNKLFFFDHGERLAADACGQWIAAEGRAVAAGLEQIHHRVDRDERRYRQASRRRAPCRRSHHRGECPHACTQTIRRCGRALTGSRRESAERCARRRAREPRAGSPRAATRCPLHPGSVRSGSRRFRRRSPLAAIRCRRIRSGESPVRTDRSRRDKPVRSRSRRSWSSGHESCHARRRCSRDRSDAFDSIAPAACCLDRRFDRFGAAAGGQRFGGLRQIGDFDQLGEKRSQLGRVIRARSDGDPLRLVGQSGDQTRMGMPVTDGGVRRHEVQIALAVGVPQPTAFAAIEDDWDRRVVRRGKLFSTAIASSA